ncbi:xanthine dehydrogenase family protein molybdopterin-binding subunit [Novosphingobium umbonatum]|uniref:Xanthine dehydrogenase family protein molybdopterin-binding subunit n=1 Tax=Novosphingobium umbonatum TaxID=1908524 RepID=A0A437N2H4_9SPHN|nr:xanthine dehydrogenase family protein molybdopterin-binding subunit [Novosphingobium umbonatum]RVU04141.1 xanthine dehydrogenase family protein molybdopterin-binding subunit [Novosphingobium umbonatum]
MNQMVKLPEVPLGDPVNVSRRGFITGAATGALVLGFGLPVGEARAQGAAKIAPGTRVPAFLEIRPDNSIRLLSPFMEGGQGIWTAMAQIVGEELDADPSSFTVENAPAGPDYLVVFGQMRITGGSFSVRSSYDTMRKLGASGRAMLLQAGAKKLGVPLAELTTEPGRVLHKASGRSATYGELAPHALDLPAPAPAQITLRDPKTFRWIGKRQARLDIRAKSTGKAQFSIDTKVDGMLHAAVQHAPRLGLLVGKVTNEAEIKAMKGVHSVHVLDGALAVVAPRYWHARRAVEAAKVEWVASTAPTYRPMPADFSTEAFAKQLATTQGKEEVAEAAGDMAAAFASAKVTLSATYNSQYLNHAQLEPPSATARFNGDGTLDLWLPNQAPEMFQAEAAKVAGIAPEKVKIHSPLLGGFFGRHFIYPHGTPYPQAIELARRIGAPVKLIWSREEEFLRDPLRPMAAVRFRAALDAKGLPTAIEAVSITEGPTEGIADKRGPKLDDSALEGITGKKYAIPNKRIAQIFVKSPTTLAYWRSVGNSMNDFFYETFLDEVADKGGQDPYALRLHLLEGNARLTNLLKAVVDLAGGWKPGPFTAPDGSKRARGLGMASPFGTETAAMAEVSIVDGQVKVHDVWQAVDPGSIVNPAIIEAQVNSAVALGLSQVLVEQAVYKDGLREARNFDGYSVLRPDMMPRVHVRIVESGAPMGGIGEPGLPAVPPAVANAVSRLLGKRMRKMPLGQIA